MAIAIAVAGPVSAQDDDGVAIPSYSDPAQRGAEIDSTGIDVIRFVTSDDFPPFNFNDPSGRLVGFNIDLSRAICEAIAVPCTVQAWPFDDLLVAVTTDRADAAIAGIEVSAAAREVMTFSDVYLRFPARFVVRRSLPLDVTDLSGRTIAVVSASAHEAFLQAFFPEADTRAYPDESTMRRALRSGDIDILFGDGMGLSFWLEGATSGNCCQFSGGAYFDSDYFGLGMAIAVSPEQPDILAALNAALGAVQASGEYASIYLRYFPVSFY